MKKKEISLANIKGKLSRMEMKNIRGGTGIFEDEMDGNGDPGCVKSGKSCNRKDKCCDGTNCPSQEDAHCP